MTRDELIEYYYDFASEGDTLIPFIKEGLVGAWGPPQRLALLNFLDRVEAIILDNVDARLDEGPGLNADPDAVREQTRREVDEARALVMQALPAMD